MKLFLLLILSLSSSYLFAGGHFIHLKGKVFVNGAPAKTKGKLTNKDKVKVGKSSLAILSLDDGSKIKLNELSEIVLLNINPSKITKVDLKSGSSFIQVLKRKFRNTKSKNKFLLKAKNTAMGIRGTKFFVAYGKKNQENVWMCVNKGIVAVKSKTEQKETLVKAGEGIVVRDGKKTSDPRSLPWTKNLNWKMDPKKGDLVNRASIEDAYSDPLNQDYD